MPSLFRLAAAVGLALAAVLTGPVTAPSPARAAAPVVCVDAGHGGSDTGTSGGGFVEKDLNLDVALRFGDLLAARYGVVYTRTGDVGLGNTERAKLCNDAVATILVSVHHNGSSNSATDYTAGLYQKRVDRELARVISANVAPATSGVDRGIIQFASGVLIKSDMPATISEGYFLTNTAEQQRLQADYSGYVETEAQALFTGVVAYLG